MSVGIFASAHVEAPPAEYLLEDAFTGTDGASWDATKWPTQRAVGESGGVVSSDILIDANRGRINGGRRFAMSAVSVTDFELLVKRQGSSVGYPEIGYRIGAGITSGTPNNGYALQFVAVDGPFRLFKIDSYSIIADISSAGFTGTTTTWFRIRVVGPNHKIRWWLDGSAEPSTWQIDVTDTSYTSGKIMLGNWGGTHYLDDLQVTDLSSLVGTIGYPVIGNSVVTTEDWYGVEAHHPATTSLTYTAGSGEEVTDVYIYGSSSSSHSTQIAVYECSGTTITNRVGSPVTVPMTPTLGWHHASCSIPLSAGVKYVIAFDFWVTGAITCYRDTITPGTRRASSSVSSLGTTWVHTNQYEETWSMYATVSAS